MQFWKTVSAPSIDFRAQAVDSRGRKGNAPKQVAVEKLHFNSREAHVSERGRMDFGLR